MVCSRTSSANKPPFSTSREKSGQGELHKVTKDGLDIIVESRWILMCDAEKPKSILTVDTNITEKKQLEAQVLPGLFHSE